MLVTDTFLSQRGGRGAATRCARFHFFPSGMSEQILVESKRKGGRGRSPVAVLDGVLCNSLKQKKQKKNGKRKLT